MQPTVQTCLIQRPEDMQCYIAEILDGHLDGLRVLTVEVRKPNGETLTISMAREAAEAFAFNIIDFLGVK